MQRSFFAALCLAGVAGLAACGGGSGDTQPPRQIDLAPAKQAEPQLSDAPLPKPERQTPPGPRERAPAPKPQPEPRVEPPPAPVESRPAPAQPTPAPAAAAPAAAAPATGTVATGTSFAVKPAMRICTNTHKPGDRFTATLAAPLSGSNGLVVPEGSIAVLRIVEAAGQPRDSMHLTYDILSIRTGDQTYEVSAHVTQSAPLERVSTQTTGDKAKKIGAGAAIGAIAGRVLGGNTKSTVLGGAIGAAAGAAVAVADQKVEGCLRENGTIELVLDRPLTIRLAQTPD